MTEKVDSAALMAQQPVVDFGADSEPATPKEPSPPAAIPQPLNTSAVSAAVEVVAANRDVAAAADSGSDLKKLVGEVMGGSLIAINDDELKIKQADPNSPLYSATTFEELTKLEGHQPIPKPIYQAITDILKYTKPSKIQASALPLLLKNPPTDMIYQAQAGTGKTAAFAITMLSRCDPKIKAVQAVCVCHTIHLAQQTAKVLSQLAQLSDIKVSCHHGLDKVDGRAQFMLQKGERITQQVLIATTGKFLSYLDRGTEHLDPKQIRVVVVDEADEIVEGRDRDKKSDIKTVKRKLTAAHSRAGTNFQMILLSATFKDHVLKYALDMVQDKAKCNVITLPLQEVTVENVKQYYMMCDGDMGKYEALETIYESTDIGQTLIFVETRAQAATLCSKMRDDGHEVDFLAGHLPKTEQSTLVERFKAGEIKVLITTNILARGIDVARVSMVVNYDIPVRSGRHRDSEEPDPETYLHRIGRTGRFGKTGSSITLVDRNVSVDFQRLKAIESHWNREIKLISVDDDDLDQKLEETKVEKKK